MLIAITGISGVGKTTILKNKLFEKIHKYFLDEYVHFLYLKDQIGYKIIKKKFGNQYVNNNHVDREKLGNLVFTNPSMLAKLNNALKPIIREHLTNLSKIHENDLVLVETAFSQYIIENYYDLFDRKILVTSQRKQKQLTNQIRFGYLSTYELNILNKNSSNNFDLTIENNQTVEVAAICLQTYLNSLY